MINQNLLKYILVLIVFSNFFVSDLFSSKTTKPKINIEMTLEAPDSIIVGEPFTVRFSFIINDTVIHKTETPDKATIYLPRECEILSGSTTWRGMLHRGSEIIMEVVAILKKGRRKTGIAGIVSTDFRRDFGRTRNVIGKDDIKVLGGEEYIRDFIDTLTYNGKRLSQKEKDRLRKIINPLSSYKIPLGYRFILSKAVYNDSSNCFYLGKFWVNSEKPQYFYIHTDDESDELIEIESWKCNNNNLILKRLNDGRYSAILSKWEGNSTAAITAGTLVFKINSVEYSIKLIVQHTTGTK